MKLSYTKANIITLVVLISGFILTVNYFRGQISHYKQQDIADFQRISDKLQAEVVNTLKVKRSLLTSIARFFQASSFIDQDEFKLYTHNFIRENNLINICWHNQQGELQYTTLEDTKDLCRYFELLKRSKIIEGSIPMLIISDFAATYKKQKGFISIVFPFPTLLGSLEHSIYDNHLILNDTSRNSILNYDIRNKKISTFIPNQELKGIKRIQKIYPLANFDGINFIYLSILNAKESFGSSHYLKRQDYIFGTLMLAITLSLAFFIRLLIVQKILIQQKVDRRTLELQEEIKRRRVAQEEAERLAKVKSEFLANMSHEIRTPMNGLLGMIDLLMDSKVEAEDKEHLLTIYSSGEDLLQILNDILDVSKLDSHKMRLDIKDFSLKQIIKSLMNLFENSARKNNVTLSLDFDDSIPMYLKGDDHKLKQIISNLLSNAIKFTKDGSVRIHCKRKVLTQTRCTVTIDVIDTGIGIEQKQLKNIFSPFTQEDTSITRKYGGTGLGLNISYQLSELMGGTLNVSSQKGVGTTFTLEIEFRISNDKDVNLLQKETNKTQLSSLPSYNILIAEDNPLNQKIIYSMLDRLGQNITTADNGELAVTMTMNQSFDLIFMDMQMPVMDGIEATKILTKKLGAACPPIIALTANVTEDDRTKCFEAGMVDFITKPVKKRQLHLIIDQYCSSHKK